MGRKSNEQKAAEANQAEEKYEVEQVSEVKTVRMVRHADYDGDGAMSADVHPLEVDNYRAGGWLIEE